MYRVESAAIHNLENTNRKHSYEPIYIMLGNHNINWFWYEWEVREYDRLIKSDCSVKEIADCLNRTVDEVMIMAIDRHMSGKLKVDDDNE